MELIFTLGAFILALGILIVFHEYGHYLVARLAGVKVLRFSVGFGTPLVKKRFGRDQTEFVIAAFPFGGYVKMLDEREGEVDPDERDRAFNTQSVWRRIAIVAAGPIANFLLAILLYWILFATGVPGLRPVLGDPPENTPAATAQLQSGDIVRAVEQVPVQTWQELRWELLEHAVAKNVVELELENEKGNIRFEKLNLSAVGPKELDAGLMKKIGVVRYDLPIAPVIGEVIKGDQRGHTIGFPTANIMLDPGMEPCHGIYAVRVRDLSGDRQKMLMGAAYFGWRPTFDTDRVFLEVFLLDFGGDLYGHELAVEFVDMIRPDQKFHDLEELVAQMKRDCDDIRQRLDEDTSSADVSPLLAAQFSGSLYDKLKYTARPV